MSNANAVLRRIEEQSKRVFLPIVGAEKGKLLAGLVKKHKPRRILEIGLLVGYSAILMADAYYKSEITSIEIIKEIAAAARRNIKEAGFEKRVEIIVGNAVKVIPKLKGKFELVFIDAAKEQYIDYIKLLEGNNLLAEKCVIVADNTKMFKSAMLDYLEHVRRHYKSKEHDFGFDAMEVSFK